jgi:hypothetical protein
MSNAQQAAHYMSLAEAWQQRVDEENGKTMSNGWSSWELECAMKRAEYCASKRDVCLMKAQSYESPHI